MRIRAGTSGFSYKEWKGPFYPEKIPAKDMLGYYAERLSTVEINNTFYRMPKRSMLEGWVEKVPDDFVFVLKASRKITHSGKLSGVEESVAYLWDAARVLGPHLGPILFQLPPFLKKDVARLREFTAILPSDMRAAFEFRHDSWFDDDTYDALRDAGSALCLADTEKTEDLQIVSTTDWGYLRLRREDYADGDLRTWKKAIEAQPWNEAFVFFKHEDEGAAPRLAKRLSTLD
jgi:uncharacterized protein YecE (DUF72 family)